MWVIMQNKGPKSTFYSVSLLISRAKEIMEKGYAFTGFGGINDDIDAKRRFLTQYIRMMFKRFSYSNL